MNFVEHSELKDLHSFLSPSKSTWLRYDEEKLEKTYKGVLAKERGTRIHAVAAELISLGIKLPRTKQTLNMYVNDAIGFRMTPEQPLFYSWNCFGTADAISFRGKKLRIHDLKTGVTPAHMDQLEVYAAIFCLEYEQNPIDLDMELRIYQSDEILIHEPDPEAIQEIMNIIISWDKKIETIKMEA